MIVTSREVNIEVPRGSFQRAIEALRLTRGKKRISGENGLNL